MASGDGPVLKLEHYTKTTPPGWRPGDPQYPVKRYLELLELWHALTDIEPAKVGVAVVPGDAFGLGGYMRISYATDEATLQDALSRIEKAIADLDVAE